MDKRDDSVFCREENTSCTDLTEATSSTSLYDNFIFRIAWGNEKRRLSVGRMLVWAVEWMALLLGLLPCGGLSGRWLWPKTALALVAALFNVTSLIIYYLDFGGR